MTAATKPKKDANKRAGSIPLSSITGRFSSQNSLSTIGSYSYIDANQSIQAEFNEVVPEEAATIVMALDASHASEICLRFYLKYLHKPGNLVHVIFVMEDYFNTSGKEDKGGEVAKQRARPCAGCCKRNRLLSMVVPEVKSSPGVLAELDRNDRIVSHEMKVRVKTLFRINGVSNQYHRVVGNETATEIVNFAVNKKGDMIIVGSRGLGALKRKVMGSVSGKVVHGSPVPVLVVSTLCDKRNCSVQGHSV